LGLEVTGRIQVGRFVLEIGHPAGTRADVAPESAGANPAPLALALSQPGPPDALVHAEEAVEEAASVTGRVERALELFTAVAQGQVDRKVVLKEVDVLIGALERADREGRYTDVIRLARALAALLALLMRWVALVQALKMALKAARALGDGFNGAWAEHELGTLSLGAEDAAAANDSLQRALRLREQIGDEPGAEVTRHNLAVLRGAFKPDGDSFWTKPLAVAAVLAGALLLTVAGLGVWLLLRDDKPPAPDTVAPLVSLDEAPESPTTERSASFAFSADEEVRTFECRLDGGPFQSCVSPHNVPGPLAFGEHRFAVRAVDFAGNTGEAARHRWRVVRGEGPQATIIEAPDPLTNETLAEFTIEAPGAIRLECRLDDTLLKSCPTVVALEVDEGDHSFVVRAFNAEDTAGPPARHLWTVDTTPPTVAIDSADRTGPETAEVTFTPGESESQIECVLLQKSPDGAEPIKVERVPECASPWAIDGLVSDLAYLVRVSATDAAGNVGPPDEAEIEAWSTVE
jgi:hypothetical protein